MHIPNGFLDPRISTGSAFAAAAVIGYCIVKVRQMVKATVPKAVLAGVGNITSTVKQTFSGFAEKHFAKMGAVGALIFAGQMFNFPVADGTSGHLLGGIIAAIALGPFSGAIVITAVLFIQSVFFADGGIMVLGANIFNMAVIGAFACYYIYYFIHRSIKNKYGYYIGVGLAAFSAVFLASIVCSLQIALSGTIELGKVIPAMASVHGIIGVAEALITIMALEALRSLKFDLEGEIKHE